MCFCQAAALFVSFFCGLVFRNKANIGQTVTARLKEGSKKSASFVLKRKNIFCVGVSTKHQNWHLSVHVLVSSFSRGSRQYRLNAPGDFSSSQGGGCWLRGLACLLACVCVCVCVSIWHSNESPPFLFGSGDTGRPGTDLESHCDI